jgi:hypothetical protein
VKNSHRAFGIVDLQHKVVGCENQICSTKVHKTVAHLFDRREGSWTNHNFQ